MPFTNFESRHFTAAEQDAINAAMLAVETALSPKLANLSPEERSQYGIINEQNKLLVNKVKDYRSTQPNLSSPDVDWEEFNNDYNSRALIESLIQRLESLTDGLKSSKILHDRDNYKASLDDYDFSKYKAGTNAPGFQTKVNEIKQFFNRTGTGKPSSETEKTDPAK
jgi:protein tyrosine/serine phosphatase